MQKVYDKLDPQVKERWIKALRSGKYKQGRSYLCKMIGDNVYHCCLGVLANEEFEGDWVLREDGGVKRYNLDGVDDQMLYPKARAKIGLDPDAATFLAIMNDNRKSFLTIANWIENNL